ncbi:hypothetical protein [Pyramidobacter sp. C12-8]|uniref:hypothetical protein n=1 Tax=Pyramidobacter sp. C12-8 TaxID=1943580 RepID=UPI00143B7BBD|nr:hypothetical protein [Pyramidobacter sp. C12-8]
MKATPQWWIDERQMQEVFQNIHIITHARRKKRFFPERRRRFVSSEILQGKCNPTSGTPLH